MSIEDVEYKQIANSLPPLVSIVILNFDSGGNLEDCLRSVFATDYPNFEVITVDNASVDQSLSGVKDKFSSEPRLRMIFNTENLGYDEGNNIGARAAGGKYIVFLNPDTTVERDWLSAIVTKMEGEPDIGMAQGKVLRASAPENLGNLGFNIDAVGNLYPIASGEKNGSEYSRTHEMLVADGCALVARADVFRSIGGFDSDFFFEVDETDLCWRAWIAGYRVVFVPGALVYHKVGVTSQGKRGNFYLKATYYFARNTLTALLKNYEIVNILKFVPILLVLRLGRLLSCISKGEIVVAKVILAGNLWNFTHAGVVLRKRRIVQSHRRIKDGVLQRKGLIRKLEMQNLMLKSRDLR